MFGSGILDTVIGVVFVFLLVSLLVTTGNELLAAVMRSRAKWLEYGINRLIGSDWAQKLYQHPLIEGSTRNYKPGPAGELPLIGSGPSYIPSRAFANILMELLQGAGNALRKTEAALLNELEMATTGATAVADIKGAVDRMATALPDILPAAIATAIRKDLAQLSTILGRNDAGRLAGWLWELEGFTEAITDLNASDFKTALTELIVDAKTGNLNAAQIRTTATAAFAKLPAGASGDMIRANVNLILTRLDAGYSVGDAADDVRRFIRAIPAGYVRHLIEELKDDKMRSTLLALFNDAGNDIEKFKQNIEVWFNNAMDRVGGWYKRRAQTVTGVIGLIVVVVMNVDALLIVRYLDANPGVRDSLVTQAQAYVDANAKASAVRTTGTAAGDTITGTLKLKFNKPALKAVKAEFSTSAPGAEFQPSSVMVEPNATSVSYTLDTAISDEPQTATVTATIPDAVVDTESLEIQPSYPGQLKRIQKQLMDLKLPIGWVRNPNQAETTMRLGLPKWRAWGEFGDVLVYHLLGWLITAIAATLGAPFWFDMLNKIMSIRSAGKSPEEAPKSPDVVQAPMGPGQSAGEASRLAALAQSGRK